MNAMTILKRCRSAESDKRRIRQKIQQRREAQACITSNPDPNGGGRGSAESDKMLSMVSKLDELERDLYQREQNRTIEVTAACALLDTLPENASRVLHKYYVVGEKLSNISRSVGYSDGYVRKLKWHGEASMGAISPDIVRKHLPDWYLSEYPEKR